MTNMLRFSGPPRKTPRHRPVFIDAAHWSGTCRLARDSRGVAGRTDRSRQAPAALGSVRAEYDQWEHIAQQQARETALAERMARELEQWERGLENSERQPPFYRAHAEYESSKQMLNPLKVLTSGVEQKGAVPFFWGVKWRFAQRMPWSDAYTESTPVIVGHYWRRAARSTGGRWVRAMRTCLPAPTRSLGTASGAMCSAWIFQRAGAGWSASQEPWWATISSWLHCAGPSGYCSLTMGTFQPPGLWRIAAPCDQSLAEAGSTSLNSAPWPSALSTSSEPPWRLTTVCTNARPRPTPEMLGWVRS